MSSDERKDLIRIKMKDQGLVEGSGVSEKDLSAYDSSEIFDLIQITRCFSEMQAKQADTHSDSSNKKK